MKSEREILARLTEIENMLRQANKKILTTKEVAEMLDVSTQRVRQLASNHEVPYYKQCGKLYFRREEIEQWQCSVRTPSKREIERKALTKTMLSRLKA